jgi:hypothetical protein
VVQDGQGVTIRRGGGQGISDFSVAWGTVFRLVKGDLKNRGDLWLLFPNSNSLIIFSSFAFVAANDGLFCGSPAQHFFMSVFKFDGH